MTLILHANKKNEKSGTHVIMNIRSFVHHNFIISLAKFTYFFIYFGQPFYKKKCFFRFFMLLKKSDFVKSLLLKIHVGIEYKNKREKHDA